MSDQGKSGGTVNISQAGSQNAAQTGSGTQKLTSVVGRKPPGNRAKYFGVGVFCLLVAVGLAIWGFALGTLTPDQRQILLWALPLASGFACGSFAGGISAKAQGILPGLLVTATGGFAVWLITSFLLFPSSSVKPTVSESAPAMTSPKK